MGRFFREHVSAIVLLRYAKQGHDCGATIVAYCQMLNQYLSLRESLSPDDRMIPFDGLMSQGVGAWQKLSVTRPVWLSILVTEPVYLGVIQQAGGEGPAPRSTGLYFAFPCTSAACLEIGGGA